MITIISNHDAANEGAENGVLKSVVSICSQITAEAKARCPVDSGRLRGSIMWRTSDGEGGFNKVGRLANTVAGKSGKVISRKKGQESSEPLTVRPKKYEGYVGTNVDYAVYIEFGTRRMKAQSFLRTALEHYSGEKALSKIRHECDIEMGKKLPRITRGSK